jgi:pimeloyl-ACP methyl ester carboxylesterase
MSGKVETIAMSKRARVYRYPDSEEIIARLYDYNMNRLDVEYREEYIETRFGQAHVVILGDEDKPPLLHLHGGNMINPLTLELYMPLARHFRLYSPDLIGHPGKSDQVRIATADNSYGEWVSDVLDGLALDRMLCFGTSYGAGIILQLATLYPKRITRAVLIVPSGIVRHSLLRMLFLIGIPSMLYKLWPTRDNLKQVIAPIGPTDENNLTYLEELYRHYRVVTRLPRIISARELKDFIAPVMILAAENDVFFPGRKVLERARRTIPNLQAADVMTAAPHMITKQRGAWICERAIPFFEA